MTGLLERAKLWAEGDPDPGTRSEIEALVAAGDLEALRERFIPELTFGTAGIRGRVGAGPARINRAMVIRTTAGLAAHVSATGPGPVVVGFDARPTSPQFASDAAAVLAAAGLEVVFFREPTPTPLVAYTAKHLGAAAAVVITASHNPPEDNGYKVYGSNWAQIIPPVDAEIAAAITQSPPADQVPRLDDPFSAESPLVEEAPDDIFDHYREEVDRVRPEATGSDLRIVYTPIHGCGGDTVSRLLAAAGHRGMIPVEEQYQPDGTFPTVGFPNPEEEGALDLAIATAQRASADLIIANDPDADRLAVALPLAGEWRALSGNELGSLLGDYVLRHHFGNGRPIVVSSVVSSPMLSRIAGIREARHEVTLTGFKWIVNAGLALEAAGEGTFVYGYEEALGYTVGQVVRDKDGMSAALVFCDLAASLRRSGETVWDRLATLWGEAGVWASAQHPMTRAGPEGTREIADIVQRLGERPPGRVGDLAVEGIIDYRVGHQARPPWLGAQDLIELSFGESGRALVRPSGTEPKIKIYVDLVEEPGSDTLRQQGELTKRAARLAVALASLLDG